MDNIRNFRKLADGMLNEAGKQLKGIYRSGDISEASSDDLIRLKNYQVSNIIDLRGPKEVERFGCLNLPIKHIDITGNGEQNIFNNQTSKDLGHIILNLYHNQFVASEGFRHCIDNILKLEGKTFLFHCAADKDRTGILGAIIMYLLDFSYEQICDEYLLVDEQLVEDFYHQMNQNETNVEIEYSSKQFLDCYLEGIKYNYSSIDGYLFHKVGITEEKRNKLKKLYLK